VVLDQNTPSYIAMGSLCGLYFLDLPSGMAG
jgi:hypothetical protein